MRTLARTLSGISLVGALGAILTGCPVWTEDNGRSGMTTPPPPVDAAVVDPTCTTNAQCAGGYCDSTTRRCTTSATCTMDSQCPIGMLCDISRRACIPGGCTSNAECAAMGQGLVCSSSTHRCTPGGQCTTDAQCAATPATPVCLGGSCQPTTNRCQFDYQCTGSGQACVDGRCVVGCTSAAMCSPGQVCTSNRCAYPTTGSCGAGCPTGQICVTGACLRTCANDTACGMGFMCDNGVCRVDTRPRPFCTMDSDCNRDSICYNGACRRLCPMPTVMPDGDCMRVDVQFNLCRADGMGRSLCTSTNEVMPQCARTSNCPSGRTCVNARCQ